MQLSVLVIDDAHALSDQVLGVVLQLAALQGEGGKMIRVLLFADSTIDERLQSSRFAGIVDPCRIELKPLQEWDSAVYLLHRLQQAGMSGGSPFSPAEMKQLYRQARGIPAQLNRAAHELLLERSRRSGMFLGLSGRSLRYGLAASALIVLVLVMHERINGVLAGGSPPLAAERQAQPLARSGRPTTVPAANSKEACDGGTAGVGCSTAAASPPPHLVGTSAEPKLNPKPEAGVAGTAAQQPVAADAVPPASQKVAKPAAMARGRVEGSDWIAAQPADHFTLQLLATSEQRGVDEFLAAHAALSGPLASFAQQREGKWLNVLIHGSYGSRVQAEAAARELPDKLQPWIREFAGIQQVVQHSAAPLVPAGQKLSVGLKDTAWVWSQDPSHYTIQLSGALDEASIEAEVRGLSLPGEFAAVQTLRNGKPWYALIYGSFSDKAAAQDAVTQLPPGVQKAGPWPRQFSALQDEIAQAGSAH
jgi:DamX protein